MATLFDDLKQGLEEAIELNSSLKKKCFVIEPYKKYSNKQIRNIRMKSNMTQTVFANFMGVSNKTVEAWERGTIHPTGPSCRLLKILDEGKISVLDFVRIEDK